MEGFMIGFNRSTLNLLVRHGRWIGDPDDENILLRYVLGQGRYERVSRILGRQLAEELQKGHGANLLCYHSLSSFDEVSDSHGKDQPSPGRYHALSLYTY